MSIIQRHAPTLADQFSVFIAQLIYKINAKKTKYVICTCVNVYVCIYVCMNLGNHEFGRQSLDNGVVGGIKKGMVQ